MFIAEMATPGVFMFLPLGVGAAGSALLAFFGVPVAVELVAFIVVSGGAYALLWPLGRKLDKSDQGAVVGSTRFSGEALVLTDIPPGVHETGTVRLDREEWRAESFDGQPISAGSTVYVTKVEGTRLVVMPLEDPSSDPPMPPITGGASTSDKES